MTNQTDGINLLKQRISALPYNEGSFDATITLVGEAPGKNEARHPEKRPFVGASGQLFRSWLAQANIDIKKCYITNLLKDHPPGDNFQEFVQKNPKTLESHTELLKLELGLLHNCNLIVPCGNEALEVITGKRGITNWRGSIIKSKLLTKTKKCIPIIHPAHIMRQWSYLTTTRLDLNRIKYDSYFSDYRLPQREYIIRPKIDDVLYFLNDLIENTRNKCDIHDNYINIPSTDIISVDTETKEGGRLATIQFCNNSKRAICIPFQYGNGTSYWSKDQEIMIWKLISHILHRKYLVGQNFLMYDTFILGVQGFDPRTILSNVYMDTMEAFQCYQPVLPKSLGYITSIYTREPFYKTEGKEGIKDWTPSVSDDKFWTYGCKDVLVVHEMFKKIQQDLVRDCLWDFYLQKFQGMARHRLDMTLRGIHVDQARREKLKVEVFSGALENQARLTVFTGHNVNVKSSKQMKKLLYDDMKLPVQYIRDGNKRRVTCNEDAILNLASENPTEIFDLILKVRHFRTLWSNYIMVKDDSDGRVRSSYGFTETGRFTSYKCPLRTGYNLQNWPPNMRVMLRSDDDDHVLIEMDLSQAESRVVAYRSRDTNLINDYNNGIDIHVQTAANIFQMIMDLVSKTQRYTGKRVNHAANYDMRAKKFSAVYNKDAAENKVGLIDVETAARFMQRHHTKHPAIRSIYHKELIEEVSKDKTLYNLWGRRVIFHERLGADLYRDAFGWYPQSTVGDLTNEIFRRIADKIILEVMNQGHDSLLVQTHKRYVNDAIMCMWKASRIPLTIEGKTLVIPVDFKVGTHWGPEMKELEVTDGKVCA